MTKSFSLEYQAPVWLADLQIKAAPAKGRLGRLFLLSRPEDKSVTARLKSLLTKTQWSELQNSANESLLFQVRELPIWVLRAAKNPVSAAHEGRLQKSDWAQARDLVGALYPQIVASKITVLELHLPADELACQGALLGLQLSSYSYLEASKQKKEKLLPQLYLVPSAASQSQFDKKIVVDVLARAEGVNLARHLVNSPPNVLNPKTYSDFLLKKFAKSSVTVDVWDEAKLKKESMYLLLAVGGAAAEKPCLVHLKYRPKTAATKSRSGLHAKPLAFVGKGITFDSGGLDIKPSSGMRWMKKDMGGSAALVGLFHWAQKINFPRPMDAYLALAENAIGSNAFRPGDVIRSRSGLSVEIHNTDAEGRLVLADAMDVAASQKGQDEPAILIDVATLTGAIKVALGAEILGLFSNHDELAETLMAAGQKMGELMWRMPLYAGYKPALKTQFADLVNASDGFGGAITAALFLEPFAGVLPWAHLDIYAWKDSPQGCFSEAGANGQPVVSLIETCLALASESEQW